MPASSLRPHRPYSRCQTAHLVPAARFLRPGFAFGFATPIKGVAERRETYGCSDTRGPARDAAGQAPARRLASHDAGRPPLRTLTVAILGSGAALPSPAFAPDQSQRAPSARVVVPGSRLSVAPATAVPEPPPRDRTPRSVCRYRSRHAAPYR